jgi:hypothetical protein
VRRVSDDGLTLAGNLRFSKPKRRDDRQDVFMRVGLDREIQGARGVTVIGFFVE